MLESTTRPLNTKEQRALRLRVASLRAAVARGRRRLLISGTAICAALWFATLLASTVSWQIVTVFWLAAALLLSAWVWFEQARKAGSQSRALAAALRDGQVREVRIRAQACVEFEEGEDEGAQYAFDLGDGTVVFVVGQEFYPSRRFPSSDFSLLYVQAPQGTLVDFFIESRGQPLTVERTIPVNAKKRLRIPEHLERVQAQLSDIERALAA